MFSATMLLLLLSNFFTISTYMWEIWLVTSERAPPRLRSWDSNIAQSLAIFSSAFWDCACKCESMLRIFVVKDKWSILASLLYDVSWISLSIKVSHKLDLRRSNNYYSSEKCIFTVKHTLQRRHLTFLGHMPGDLLPGRRYRAARGSHTKTVAVFRCNLISEGT